MTLNLDELERLEKAVPRKIWTGYIGSHAMSVFAGKPRMRRDGGREVVASAGFDHDDFPRKQREATAVFIAALRNAAPAMIARIRELERQVAEGATPPADHLESEAHIALLKQVAELNGQVAERDARIAELLLKLEKPRAY